MSNTKRPAKATKPATQQKRRGSKSVPYDKILAEYVADETTTVSSLAKKFGVSKSAISRKATKEDWKSKRKLATEKAVESVTSLKAEQIADANKRHVEGSKEVQEAILNGIRWINSHSDQITKGRGKNKKVIDAVPGTVLFAKQMAELVGSYRRAADLERAALGIATTVGKLGDEDGEEPIIFDIMGGLANANSGTGKAKPTGPASS